MHELPDRLLLRRALGLLLRTRGALLLRLRQRLEALLLLEPRDPLGARLEVEPQGALDGDLAEAEVGGGEDSADDDLLLLASFVTVRVSPSLKSARIFRMSCARSSGISRRLSPRLLRIGDPRTRSWRR